MRFLRPLVALLAVSVVLLGPGVSAQRPPAAAHHQPTVAQYLKPGLPSELVSARKVDRLAWIAYEEGKRNVFTAAGPLFRPVRATSFLKDDGVDMTGVKISDDGSTIVFVRGSAPNSAGWCSSTRSRASCSRAGRRATGGRSRNWCAPSAWWLPRASPTF